MTCEIYMFAVLRGGVTSARLKKYVQETDVQHWGEA